MPLGSPRIKTSIRWRTRGQAGLSLGMLPPSVSRFQISERWPKLTTRTLAHPDGMLTTKSSAATAACLVQISMMVGNLSLALLHARLLPCAQVHLTVIHTLYQPQNCSETPAAAPSVQAGLSFGAPVNHLDDEVTKPLARAGLHLMLCNCSPSLLPGKVAGHRAAPPRFSPDMVTTELFIIRFHSTLRG